MKFVPARQASPGIPKVDIISSTPNITKVWGVMISRRKEEHAGGGLLARSIVLVLILSSLLFVSHAQVEYETGERMAEMLYERGIGGPWITRRMI